MKRNIFSLCLVNVLLGGLVAMPVSENNITEKQLLKKAESQLRPIYELGEFKVKRFRADWLSDSSGYTTMESVPGSDERVRVRYDIADGKRTVMEDASEQDKTSPHSGSEVYSDKGNLYIRNLKSKKSIPLTKLSSNGNISNSRPVLSPDGKWIAFVQTDTSRIKRRSMIIPGDPTFPEVKKSQFSPVGGEIPMLKVGVIDASGSQTRWLSIPLPSEGYYLGQVDWAGNSHELLVEKLSRFRDKREFLLADILTGTIRTIFEETDPAWVVASYRKNAGLTWINNYQRFIVITDRTRHCGRIEGAVLLLRLSGKCDAKISLPCPSGWNVQPGKGNSHGSARHA